MLGRLLKIYGTINRTFGFTIRPLFTFWLYMHLRCFATVTLWLDHLLFPGFKQAEVKAPVFIIGNPRGGSTFLHRFMEEHFDLCSFRVWQMVMPSLTGQKLMKPFVKYFARFAPVQHGKVAHDTGLDAIETDDAIFGVRFIDGFLLYCWWLAWDEKDYTEAFATMEPDSPETQRDLDYYHKCLLRNLHQNPGKRVLGKPFNFSMRAEAALERYPDAKLIYVVRDPEQMLPSVMSLLTNLADMRYKVSKLEQPIKDRYNQRLYDGAQRFVYGKFHESYTGGKRPQENVLVIRFPDMMQDFEGTMERIVEFADLDLTDAAKDAIAARGEKQRAYKSKHKYSLEMYGLDAEKIREDLSYVYETYDL